MEEEIIRSKKRNTSGAKKIICALLIIAVLCFVVGGIEKNVTTESYEKARELERYKEYMYEKYLDLDYDDPGYDEAKEKWEKAVDEYHDFDIYYGYQDMYFMIGVGSIILTVLIAVIYYGIMSKMEIIVTNKRVYGKTAFGKRVDLPIDSISVVGTSFLKGIDVGTSSGKIKFKGIKNYMEIHKVIIKLLNERQ